MIKIRLARLGRKKKPIYSIVAIESARQRDGKFLEKLGQYDPMLSEGNIKDLKLDSLKKWMGNGAKLSTTVNSLLKKHNVTLKAPS